MQNLPSSIGNLSRAASSVGAYMLERIEIDSGLQVAFNGKELSKGTGLNAEFINDAVDELEEAGLVKTYKVMGMREYKFRQVEPTYVLFREFSQILPYNPEDDIKMTAAAVASLGNADGNALLQACGLSPGRLNRAVEYLEDYGIVQVIKWMGTRPYTFGEVVATRRTKQFVQT